jgi:hypothetical protein
MLIIRGVNVLPSQIESVLLKNTSVQPHYHINVDRVNNLDTMEIVVELSPNVSVDEVAHVEEIRRKLVADMASALSGRKFRTLIFDACFMASVEARWELRAVTNKVIASPIEIMSAGFPYTPIIKSLFGDWNNLAELCRIYIDSYKISWAPHAAVSLVDLTQLDALAESVADVLQSARKIEKNWLSSVNELQYYEGLVNHVFYDLGDCMNKIATDSAALGRFDRALGRVVLFEDHTDMGYSDFCRGEYPLRRCSGLSVYVARKNFPKFRASYLQTGWAQNAGEICYE